jgi:hypothetical protein
MQQPRQQQQQQLNFLLPSLSLANAIAHLSVAHRIAAPILLKNSATYIGRNLKCMVGTDDWNKLLKENPIALDAILKMQAKWT